MSVTFVADLIAVMFGLVNTIVRHPQGNSRQFEDLSIKKWESYGSSRLRAMKQHCGQRDN